MNQHAGSRGGVTATTLRHLPSPVAQVEHLTATWTATPSTRQRMGDLMRRFALRLASTGVVSLYDATSVDCDGFVWAVTKRSQQPAMHTVHLRRSALRTLYRLLRDVDPTAPNPTLDVALPAKPTLATRPVTDNELDLIRTTALGRPRTGLRSAAVVALAEATATTGEIPHIHWPQLDLDTGIVQLPGANPVAARTGTLTPWGIGVLRRHQQHLPTKSMLEGPVADRHTTNTDTHVAQAAITNLLAGIITAAGLDDPTLKPASIRLWAAQQHLHHSGIEAATRALGWDSLDRAADALDHQWRTRS